MTDNNHPITPPPELVEQWCYEDGDEIRTSPRWYQRVCAKAARWGADMELEACCEWLDDYLLAPKGAQLRDARRSKPLSLKEEALALLQVVEASDDAAISWDFDVIRRALESLPD